MKEELCGASTVTGSLMSSDPETSLLSRLSVSSLMPPEKSKQSILYETAHGVSHGALAEQLRHAGSDFAFRRTLSNGTSLHWPLERVNFNPFCCDVLQIQLLSWCVASLAHR